MKPIFLVVFLSSVLFVPTLAQEVAQEGIIQLKIDNTAGENTGAMPQGMPEGATIMRFGDSEIKAKLFFKNGMTKMETDMGFGTNQTIYDSKTKTTTTLFEMMGQKMGFYSNEEELKKIRAADTSRRQQLPPFTPEIFIEYLSDSKKIAGMNCKKAIIRYTTRRGEDMAQEVWYSPDFKMNEGIQMGEVLRMANVPGIQKLKGFPMEFLIKRANGSTSHYLVTKVDLTAKIDDKAFVVPKDYDVKPMSEMNQMGRGRGNMMFRMGN